VWGNAASVLVGDFLISRAFQMIVGTHDIRVMSTLSDATNLIAEGEVLQLLNCKNPATTEAQYRRVIYCKTAKMFEVSTQIGAMIAKVEAHKEDAMRDYGKHLGMAFQIQDDILDYTGDATTLGKNIGDDFAEGKVTLPIIYALMHAQPTEQAYLKQAILSGNVENIEMVISLLQSTGAIEYCQKVAREEAAQARNHLNCLKPSIYRDALEQLTEFALLRKS
jgi:octaprenyl-diphosphate synthase